MPEEKDKEKGTRRPYTKRQYMNFSAKQNLPKENLDQQDPPSSEDQNQEENLDQQDPSLVEDQDQEENLQEETTSEEEQEQEKNEENLEGQENQTEKTLEKNQKENKKTTSMTQNFQQNGEIQNILKQGPLDMQDFKDLQKNYPLKDSSSAKQIGKTELDATLTHIRGDRKCTTKEAFIAIALLCQMGGTSSRAQGNMQITLKETTFSLELIQKTIKNHAKKSVRRFAKSFANEFQQIARSYGIIGNLTNKVNLNSEIPLTEEESFWASDFQSDNPDCPQIVRDRLNDYYNKFVNIPRNKNSKKKK